MKFLRFGMTALLALSLTACPERGGDPADDDSGGMMANGGTPTTGGMPATGGTPNMGGTPMGGTPMGGTPAMGGTPGGSMGDGGNMGTGGGMPFGVCPDEITFTGQLKGSGPDVEVPDGGNGVTTPYAMDFKAGIAELLDAIPEEADELAIEDTVITGALVIATNYYTDRFDVPPNQSRFWIADADGAIELYLDYRAMDTTPNFQVRTGQNISFTVTNVTRYRGKPQISAATDWTLNSADNDVSMFEPDRELTSSDVHRLVRITGTLSGSGDPCDSPMAENPNRCWDLDYGFGLSAVFRTKSTFVATGGCVTFVGPMGWFDGRPQLDSINFSWLKSYD